MTSWTQETDRAERRSQALVKAAKVSKTAKVYHVASWYPIVGQYYARCRYPRMLELNDETLVFAWQTGWRLPRCQWCERYYPDKNWHAASAATTFLVHGEKEFAAGIDAISRDADPITFLLVASDRLEEIGMIEASNAAKAFRTLAGEMQ